MYAQGPVKSADIIKTGINNTLVAAVSGKKIRVISMLLINVGVTNVTMEDGVDGSKLTGTFKLGTKSPLSLPEAPNGWFETSVNTLLNMTSTGAVPVRGHLRYQEID